jgi:hypothetical protein
MFSLKPYPALLALVVLLVYAQPALAFGAGNIASISKVEGQNCKSGPLLPLFILSIYLSFCLALPLPLTDMGGNHTDRAPW